MFDARVKAVLGPTNTGKTHLAITRLLGHASGIIGFPLRLLARENYDRMVAAKGEKHVALITGEEKIVPPDARWFACTVEAMPLDRRAEFVAVDEIQLCADPDRGHVFTDRLLNARGMVETMFLGAETIRPLLARLVPKIEFDTRARLSQLTYAGPAKLTRLPPRSAVVAFSAAEVYSIAEAIRRSRGGCAVVMGRLSPRTRNAQVALYQNREVDFLVATDAIGMGLNMDVDHVAFASLQKFDGHQARRLTPQEAAQIAGRAGRGMRDGSFGVTADCPPLDEDVVEKIETHRFEPLEALAWRNSELEFASIDALLDSLAAPPPQAGLAKGHDAVDHITLEALARDAEIRGLAQGRTRVRLLWEACSVPDFRKLADETHTKLCGRIFTHLAQDGRLPDDWVAAQIAQCASTEGDLDTLMARLAHIRVWSYVAARADWMADAARFQAEARAAEDGVSDALHERLTARFVDRRAAHLMRRLDATEEELLSAVTRRGEVVVEGHPVGRVEGFVFHPVDTTEGEEERKLILRAARRALKEEMPRRVAALETAKDDGFALTGNHRVTWTHPGGDPAEVARLRPGPEPAKPQVEVLPSEFLDGAQRERVRGRLAKYVEGLVGRELAIIATIEAKAEADNTLRGPAFVLREALGLAPDGTDPAMPHDVKQKLKSIGVKAGRYALFVPEALKPRAMALRAQIWALSRNIPTPELPPPGMVALPLPQPEPPPPEAEAPAPERPGRSGRGGRDAAMAALAAGWPPGFAPTMGWMPLGPALIRLDVAERIAGELSYLTRRAPAPPPPDLASRLGVKADMLGVTLTAMGFRLLEPAPLEPDRFGPPTPLRVAQQRAERFAPPARGGRNEARGPRRAERGPPRDAERGPPRDAERGAPRDGERGPPRDAERGAPPRRSDRGPPRTAEPAMVPDEAYGPPSAAEPPAQGDRPAWRDAGRGPRGPRPPRDEPRRADAPPPIPVDPNAEAFGPPVPADLEKRRIAIAQMRLQVGPNRDGQRRDGPRQDRRSGPGGPPGAGGPRSDRPWQDGPRRDRSGPGNDAAPPPRAASPAPGKPGDPDNPFAVLSKLKLR